MSWPLLFAIAASAVLLLIVALVCVAIVVGVVRWFFNFLDSQWWCPMHNLQLHRGEETLPTVGGAIEGHR